MKSIASNETYIFSTFPVTNPISAVSFQ